MPYHIALDGLREDKGGGGIGTTRRGIGPTYEFKAARCGIRMGHLDYPELFGKLVRKALKKANPEIERLGGKPFSETEMINFLLYARRYLSKYVINIHPFVHTAHKMNMRILFEGAQGAILDVDHGTYPFVTSSTTLASAAASGCGLGPMHIEKVIGVVKAYITRVGEGPFPTEIHGPLAEKIRKKGKEQGATTGRDRRVGWLDLPQLRYACQANGIRELFWTKLDVLRGIHPLKVCVAYRIDGKTYTNWNDVPTELLDKVEPVYEEIDGFDEDISGARLIRELSMEALGIPRLTCRLLKVEISGISVGPDRKQTVIVNRYPVGFSHDGGIRIK